MVVGNNVNRSTRDGRDVPNRMGFREMGILEPLLTSVVGGGVFAFLGAIIGGRYLLHVQRAERKLERLPAADQVVWCEPGGKHRELDGGVGHSLAGSRRFAEIAQFRQS